MAFQRLVRNTFYFTLYACYALLITGCAMSNNTIIEDGDYYATWEGKISDTNTLIWYYNTIEDFNVNQPNMVSAYNKKFIVHPDVRPPTMTGVYMLEYSEINDGEEVLDIGTGSGLHAVLAAEKAKRVVATDIYAPAVENAKVNARLHGVEHKIDFRVGDLFEPIHDDEKFDIFFININFPFSNSNEKRNKLHERLFSEIGKHMKPDARIYYQTSFIKNIPYIYDMLSRNNLVIKEVHMEHHTKTKHEPLFIMAQSSKK